MSISVSSRSVLARRGSRDTATLVECMTKVSTPRTRSHRASQNPSRPDSKARTVRVIALPAFVARSGRTMSATLTTLVSFNDVAEADGADPEGDLIADSNGDLFGTTSGGVADADGTVFEIVKTARGYASTPTT